MRALDLDSAWGKKCDDTLTLLSLYGSSGTRYKDPRVIDMLEDITYNMPQFWRLLRLVDESYQEDLLYQSLRTGQSLVDSLLQDPTAWQLMMDWAEDKIRYGELDAKMHEYGSRYIHEEWKSLIDEIFVQSEPGVDHTATPSVLVQQAMEVQGVTFSTMTSPAPCKVIANPSTLSQGSICQQRTTRKTKHCKLDTNPFVDITVEEEEEGEGSDCRPEVIGPSGKQTFQNKVDAIIDWFSRWGGSTTLQQSSEKIEDLTRHSCPLFEPHIHSGLSLR